MPQPPKRQLTQQEKNAEAVKLAEATRINNQKMREIEKKMNELKAKHLAEKIAGKTNVQAPNQAQRIEYEEHNFNNAEKIRKHGHVYHGNELVTGFKCR